jgi:hypothetical protein
VKARAVVLIGVDRGGVGSDNSARQHTPRAELTMEVVRSSHVSTVAGIMTCVRVLTHGAGKDDDI